MPVKPVPEGYQTITPQLNIDGAARAIAFYEQAFGAVQVDRAEGPDGKKVMHCSLRVGSSMLFVNDVFPEMGGQASQAHLWLYVPDVDASFQRAVGAGASPQMSPTDCFWGDRMGQVADPFGQKWTLATRTRELTPEEIKAAEADFLASMAKQK